MSGHFGVYHDVDGCAFVGHDKRIVYRSVFYCKYNDAVSTPVVLDRLLKHGVVDKNVVKMFEAERGDIKTPADIVRLGEYARFDQKVSMLGKTITKEAQSEIDYRATENLSLEAFYQSLREAVPTPGLEDFAGWTRSNCGKQVIVTDGWDLVGSYLAEIIGADRCEGSVPIFRNGRFTGEVRKTGDKKSVLDRLLIEVDATYQDSIGIDDASPVIADFGLSIAFCPTNFKLRENPKTIVIEEPHYKHVQKAAEEWLAKR
ncbi:MAG: hypothetical protein V1836_01545 [Candidatus Aenigmatarchaeota archaeon]